MARAKRPPAALIRPDELEALKEACTDSEIVQYISAVVEYARSSTEPDRTTFPKMVSLMLKIYFPDHKAEIDEYRATCAKNAEIAKERERKRKEERCTNVHGRAQACTNVHELEVEVERKKEKEREREGEAEGEPELKTASASASADSPESFDGDGDGLREWVENLLTMQGFNTSAADVSDVLQDAQQYGREKVQEALIQARQANTRDRPTVTFYRAILKRMLQGDSSTTTRGGDYIRRMHDEDYYKSCVVSEDELLSGKEWKPKPAGRKMPTSGIIV